MVIVSGKKWLYVAACILVLMAAGGLILVGGHGDSTSGKQDAVNQSAPVQKETDARISGSTEQGNFFSEYRMERERLRGRQIEMLQELLNNTSSDQKAREAASLRLVKITEDMEKEMKAEGLVKSKGFEDCTVIIQPQCTTVVVQAPNLRLDQEEAIKKLVSAAVQCNEDDLALIVREKP